MCAHCRNNKYKLSTDSMMMWIVREVYIQDHYVTMIHKPKDKLTRELVSKPPNARLFIHLSFLKD